MTHRSTLGGWWRLWIVCSVIWLISVVSGSYALFPGDGMASHSVEFVNSLPEKYRNRLSLDGTSPIGTEAEFPNGYVMKFRAGISQDEMSEVAREYAKNAAQSHKREQRSFLKAAAAVATVPIALTAILGLSIAWVRRGFKGASEA
jgi:hypothetical protein